MCNRTKLIESVVELSVSKEWDIAKTEWETNDSYHTNGDHCTCGVKIKWVYQIKNTLNGNVIYKIGSVCIRQFGVQSMVDQMLSLDKLYHNNTNKQTLISGSEANDWDTAQLEWHVDRQEPKITEATPSICCKRKRLMYLINRSTNRFVIIPVNCLHALGVHHLSVETDAELFIRKNGFAPEKPVLVNTPPTPPFTYDELQEELDLEDVYLTTAYCERKKVKDRGARYDGNCKKWYVPKYRSHEFSEWLPENQHIIMLNATMEQKDEVKELGAKYDASVKKWYIYTSMQNSFKKWM